MSFVYVTVLSVNILFRPTGQSNMESISSFDQPLLTYKELLNTLSGIYPSTLTNVRFWEEDSVLKGKKCLQNDCFYSFESRTEPWRAFWGQRP